VADGRDGTALWIFLLVGALAVCGGIRDARGPDAQVAGLRHPRPPSGRRIPSLAELTTSPEANANNIGVRLASEGRITRCL
jgi:hypothetical protein